MCAPWQDYKLQPVAIRIESMYSPLLLEHFEHPRNVGELEDADAKVTVENPACGDVMVLTLKVSDGNKSRAAELLSIKRSTLGDRIARCGLIDSGADVSDDRARDEIVPTAASA